MILDETLRGEQGFIKKIIILKKLLDMSERVEGNITFVVSELIFQRMNNLIFGAYNSDLTSWTQFSETQRSRNHNESIELNLDE